MHAPTQNDSSLSKATQLLPALRLLENGEKLFIIQFLVSELSRKESPILLPDQVFPVWSPHDSHSAADTLLQALAEYKSNKAGL